MSTSKRKINREEVYKEVEKLIQESSSGEREISSSDLTKFFDVQAPSIDYHLRKLIDEERLILSDKRGRYNRKIYSLPDSNKEEVSNTLELVYDQSELEYFTDILKKKMNSKGIEPPTQSEMNDVITTNDEIEEEKPSAAIAVEELELTEQKEEDSKPLVEEDGPDLYDPQEEEYIEEVQADLSLDVRIESFLKQSKDIPNAERILSLQDKEVLSVMNESIQQNIVYLKDLSEQLSTIQNKELIQSLIDERNDYLKEKEVILEDREFLRSQLAEKTGKFDLDPKRIRLIQQNIINVLDMYLDQPNHTLALGRHEFRNAMTKQINDAFRYILNLEK